MNLPIFTTHSITRARKTSLAIPNSYAKKQTLLAYYVQLNQRPGAEVLFPPRTQKPAIFQQRP